MTNGGAAAGPAADGGGANGSFGGSAATGNIGTAATGNITVGDGGDLGTGPVVATALVFDPKSVTLTLGEAGAVKTASYTLKATLEDGSERTVPAESLEFDRPDLASFELGPPALLTATGAVAGTGTLHAVFGGKEATAKLVVNIVESQTEGTVPKKAINGLNEDDLADDPALSELLYPYDKTVFPLGLSSPLMMWDAPNPKGDVYRVHLEQKGYQYDYYSVVAAPAQVRVPQDAWDRVTASNTGDVLKLTVSRWDAATSTAYTSVSERFTIAPESLRGAIYYWTASQTDANDPKTRIGNIQRVYPGAGAKPEVLNKGRCMGCHSVSADGTTMVATIEDPSAPSEAPYENWTGVRAWASFELPDGKLANQTTKSGANSALTPDGKYVVFGGRAIDGDAFVPGSKFISLALTATGDVIANSGLDDLLLPNGDVVKPNGSDGVMMPSFSPDGSMLALVQSKTGSDLSDNVIPTSVRIFYLDFNQKKAKFDAANIHEVVKASDLPAGNDQLGYPSFSPDGKYIAYHTGQFSTGCHSDPDPTVPACQDPTFDSGELWVSPTAGGTPIRMANIDDPPLLADHATQREPTFCPVERGGYSWVVFTSMRNWGNQLTGPVKNGKRRLWVAAVDKKLGTVDPSHPAFYVEGQDDATPNMRGFWALAKCIETPKKPDPVASCTANFECCSGFCIDGQCGDKTSLSCAGVGSSCEEAKDCCNAGVTDCIDGTCQIPEVPK
ncbi:MAG: hypothetical protein ABW061_11225 [Polyangiaceae bacterium]